MTGQVARSAKKGAKVRKARPPGRGGRTNEAYVENLDDKEADTVGQIDERRRLLTILQEQLKMEKRHLEEILQKIEQDMKNAPEGSLRVSYKAKTKKPMYYQYGATKDKERATSVYINKGKQEIIPLLAQKGYAQKLEEDIQKQLNLINSCLDHYQPNLARKVYEAITDSKKPFVKPYELSFEEYASQWLQESYTGKEFLEDVGALFTEKGERVRSKSELIIANQLHKMNVPYKYEHPLKLHGYGTVYPDFTILSKNKRELYWEHFGMVDDPEYFNKMTQKIETYENNHIFPGDGLILTFETSRRPLNTASLVKIINKYSLE